jgi:hypothetical protein
LRQSVKAVTSGTALATPDGLGFLEILGAVGHDPQVAVGALDGGDDHAAGAQIEPELYRNEDDREQNADQRHGQADAIVKQVANGQGQGHRDGGNLSKLTLAPRQDVPADVNGAGQTIEVAGLWQPRRSDWWCLYRYLCSSWGLPGPEKAGLRRRIRLFFDCVNAASRRIFSASGLHVAGRPVPSSAKEGAA